MLARSIMEHVVLIPDRNRRWARRRGLALGRVRESVTKV